MMQLTNNEILYDIIVAKVLKSKLFSELRKKISFFISTFAAEF